jgi:hypothetical protein
MLYSPADRFSKVRKPAVPWQAFPSPVTAASFVKQVMAASASRVRCA